MSASTQHGCVALALMPPPRPKQRSGHRAGLPLVQVGERCQLCDRSRDAAGEGVDVKSPAVREIGRSTKGA